MLIARETELGTFLSDYSEDAESLQSLVIDEIERALPRIIANLRIPSSLDENDAQLLEFRLSGKPGFRRLNEKDREKAKKKLENETFLRSLRKAQETLSNGILAGTSKSSQVVIVDGSESGGGFGDLLPQIVHPRDTQILEKFEPPEHELVRSSAASAGAHTFQGELPFEVVETFTSETLRDGKDMEEPVLDIPDIPIELQEPLVDRDVRDLVALIKSNRLVCFLDPAVENLIPRGINKIRIPKTRLYASLNLDRLIEKYHELVVAEDTFPASDDELRLLDSLIVAMEHEAQWSRINTRRFHLINKKHSMGLERDEKEELSALDQLAEKQMHAVQNLPFNELAMLKLYARRLGFSEDVGHHGE